MPEPDKARQQLRVASAIESREDRVSAFIQIQEGIAKGIWLQSWLVYEEKRHGGSVKEFAYDVDISVGWAYKLLKNYEAFGEDRIENLSATAHVIAAHKSGGDPVKARKWGELAADSGWTKDRLAAEMDKSLKPSPNGHAELEAGGDSPQVHEQRMTCPTCKGDGFV
jgi:hypothetical protein